METIVKPAEGDYPIYYKAYMMAARGQILSEALQLAGEWELETRKLVPDDRWEFRYAPGKWTTKEVYQHIIDMERIFSYRALCFARGEKANLPAADEDAYQVEARTQARQVDDMMRELRSVRQSTVELFASLDAIALGRSGKANGKHITVPALGWVIAGHSEHHLRIIRERYLA
jgi:hypothetical protein